MVPRSFLDTLHCPACGSALRLTLAMPTQQEVVEYGLLRCDCGEYPILDGIVVLQHHAPWFFVDFDRAIRHLKAGEPAKALASALWIEPTRTRRILNLSAKLHVPRSRGLADKFRQQAAQAVLRDHHLGYQDALAILRPAYYGHYLYHRYANLSFLAAVILQLLLRKVIEGLSDGVESASDDEGQPVTLLDLCSGVGHGAFLLNRLYPRARVICCDSDFTNLYIARRYMTRQAWMVCANAEMPLPFADAGLDAVLCNDAFHYVQSKSALAAEVERILDPAGLWLFAHLHNARVDNPTPGTPLDASGYQRLLGRVPGRLITEPTLIGDYARHRRVDLRAEPSASDLHESHAFAWIAGRDTRRWCRRFEQVSFPPAEPAVLGVNPLYRVEPRGEQLVGQIHWANPQFERECSAVQSVLPESWHWDRRVLRHALNGAGTPADQAYVQELLNTFQLVHLPPGYGHLELSALSQYSGHTSVA